MRHSKSMIEAVKQVCLYEALDYAIVDGDNKIIGLYKGNMAKKHAELNMKGAERQVGVKKPLKIMPVSNKKKGDTVIGIGELTDKQRGEIEEENIRVLVKDVKDRNFIKDLTNKAKQLKDDVSEKGGRYIFSGEKMKVNDVFNFAFDKSIKRIAHPTKSQDCWNYTRKR